MNNVKYLGLSEVIISLNLSQLIRVFDFREKIPSDKNSKFAGRLHKDHSIREPLIVY